MAKISACLIAKNEEGRIDKCLASIFDIVDEIIVVDTGSTDKTKEIAELYGAKVFDFEWINDFSAARNLSFSKVTGDWIIWLDCDDVFAPGDIIKFKALKRTLDTTDTIIFDFWYNYRHDAEGKCTYKFQRDRLIKNLKDFHWEYPVHEALLVSGKMTETDICVTHTSNDDNGEKYITFFKDKIKNEGYILKQRDMYYYGGELAIFGHTDESQAIFEQFFAMGEHNNQYEAKRAAEYLFNIYLGKEMYLQALETEFKYLKYGYPDPKIFYKLGSTFAKLNKIEESIFYYKTAITMRNEFPKETCVVNEYAIHVFNCALELVVLLYKRDKVEAKEYHDLCKKLDPTNSSVIFNERFFEIK